MKKLAELFTIGNFTVYEEIETSIEDKEPPELEDNPDFREMKNLIMESLGSGHGESKNHEKIDLVKLAGFAKTEGLAFENEVVLGGRRMGKFI